MEKFKDFEWGNVPLDDINIITEEIFVDNMYLKHSQVNENDVVVDIGANCGAFTCSILEKNPKKVYCIEPDPTCFDCLRKNILKYSNDTQDFRLINRSIGNFDHDMTIKFKTLLEQHSITHIDFLKVDCEGGEFSIFTEENYDFITNNVKNISCEFHITNHNNSVQNFIYFRDKYFDSNIFKTIKVYDRWENDYSSLICDNNQVYDFERFYARVNSFAGQFIIYLSK